MIAEGGGVDVPREGTVRTPHCGEKTLPVPRGFAVVDKVADECRKIGMRMAPPRRMIEVAPHVIALAALTVGEEKGAYGTVSVGVCERYPRTCAVRGCEAIVAAASWEPYLRAVGVLRRIVYVKIGIGRDVDINMRMCSRGAHLDAYIREEALAVPLDHARRLRIMRDDLPQIFDFMHMCLRMMR